MQLQNDKRLKKTNQKDGTFKWQQNLIAFINFKSFYFFDKHFLFLIIDMHKF